jgi:hypothetical protein
MNMSNDENTDAGGTHVLSPQPRRLGFLAGRMTVPEDFDTMGQAEIIRMFEGESPEDMAHD